MIIKLYAFFISFFLGIFLSSLNFYFFTFYASALLFSFVSFIIFFSKNRKVAWKIFLLFLSSSAFLLSSAYYHFYNESNKGEFDNFLGQKITQRFVVDDEPEKKSFQTKLILKFPNSKSRTLAWVPNYPEYSYGDLIEVEGYLLKPKNFKSQQGIEFDYVSFLKKDKIFYEVKVLDIKFLEAGHGGWVKEKLFKLKASFLKKIKEIMPGQEASFLGGLLLGAKEDMGKELLEDFRRTGVIHIVVLSGFNLTLVAYFFMKIFAFLGIVYSTLFASIAIVLFTLMTGASATIVRAALMALLVIVARATGRTSEIIRILFLAAFLMLLFNPMLLVFDPSFQLSFLATLGLLLLSPKIEDFLTFLPKGTFDLRGILAATLATQVFVFPLLLYMMGEISVISPIVNILILIFIPAVMLIGFVAVVFAYLSIFVGTILAFIVYLVLSYNLWLVEWFSDFSYATFSYILSFWEMLFIYFLYFLIYLLYKKLSTKAILK